MKKKYMNPEMEVVEIKTTCMLAASLPLNDTPTIDNQGDILAPEENVELLEFDF